MDMLIDSASAPVDWSKYRDDTAAELLTLIEAKLAGQPLPAPAEESTAMLHLLDALKQSVAATRKRPPAAKSSSRTAPVPKKAIP